ncbi:hypothetical protein D3C80_2025040 [compost metagenome]
MKLGRVVTVWINFRNLTALISVRKMAKIMGSQENRMPSPLIPNVFLTTCSS